jgi:hypothetical protein
MKGILRVTLLFHTSERLQRWLLAAGVPLLVVASQLDLLISPCSPCSPGRPPGPVQSLLQLMLFWVVPATTLTIGAITIRQVSALRTLRFVPYARMQLLLGMLLAQVPFALLLTVCIAVLHRAAPVILVPLLDSLTHTFEATLALATLWTLWVFVVSANLWFGVISVLLILQVGVVRSHSVFPSDITDAGIADFLVVLALAAASLFALWYVRVRTIAPPQSDFATLGFTGWNSGHATATSRRAGINTYLLGQPSVLRATRRQLSFFALINAMVLGTLAFARLPSPAPADFGLGPVIMVFCLSSIGNYLGRTVAADSRHLWIRGGCSRLELFRTAERLTWTCLAILSAGVFMLSGAEWLLLPHGDHDWPYLIVVLLATVTCSTYLGLMNFNGVAGVDVAEFALSIVIVFFVLHYAFLSPDEPGASIVRSVVAIAEIIGAFALRALALRRWRRVDWLKFRPRRTSSPALPLAA